MSSSNSFGPKSGRWMWLENFAYSLFVFLLSYNFSPLDTYDRYRHAERYEYMARDQIGFWDYYISGDQKDFLYYVIMYFGDYVGLSGQVFFAFVNAFSVFVIVLSFQLITKCRSEKIVLVLFLISFSYISLFSGVRFFLALSFFSLFVVFFHRGSLLVALLLLALASAIHFSFSIFIVAFVVRIVPRVMLPMSFLALFMVVLSLAGVFDVYSTMKVLSALSSNEAYDRVSRAYDELQGEAHRNVMFYVFNFWLFLPAFYYFIVDRTKSPLVIVLFLTIFVMVFYINNYPIFGRFFLVMVLALFFCVADREDDKFKRRFVFILGVSSVVRFVLEIHDNLEVYVRSYF